MREPDVSAQIAVDLRALNRADAFLLIVRACAHAACVRARVRACLHACVRVCLRAACVPACLGASCLGLLLSMRVPVCAFGRVRECV